MPTVEVTRDETDKKASAGSYDPYYVHGKRPGFRYRMLNKNKDNLDRKRWEGYEIVQGNDPERLGLTESTPLKKGEDNATTREYKDLVLARIPEEKVVAKGKANRELINRRTAASKEDFMKVAGGRGYEERGSGTGYAGSMNEAQFAKILAEEKRGKK